MLNGKKVVVVMPAYNAATTLRMTYDEIDRSVVDEVILVDDDSSDDTVSIAKKLNLHYIVHEKNLGYGANQKTCYRRALGLGADIVVLIHPDYQYSPKLITAMAGMVGSGVYDAVIGSRILGKGARSGGMPLYKYVANRLLTLLQNLVFGMKLSEYHTGLRAFSREALLCLPLEENSDDFVFDNQILAQLVHFNYEMGEISCPAKYFEEASSINWYRSIFYGLGVLKTTSSFIMARSGLHNSGIFSIHGKKLQSH